MLVCNHLITLGFNCTDVYLLSNKETRMFVWNEDVATFADLTCTSLAPSDNECDGFDKHLLRNTWLCSQKGAESVATVLSSRFSVCSDHLLLIGERTLSISPRL